MLVLMRNAEAAFAGYISFFDPSCLLLNKLATLMCQLLEDLVLDQELEVCVLESWEVAAQWKIVVVVDRLLYYHLLFFLNHLRRYVTRLHISFFFASLFFSRFLVFIVELFGQNWVHLLLFLFFIIEAA